MEIYFRTSWRKITNKNKSCSRRINYSSEKYFILCRKYRSKVLLACRLPRNTPCSGNKHKSNFKGGVYSLKTPRNHNFLSKEIEIICLRYPISRVESSGRKLFVTIILNQKYKNYISGLVPVYSWNIFI